jgi:hypothetical protein
MIIGLIAGSSDEDGDKQAAVADPTAAGATTPIATSPSGTSASPVPSPGTVGSSGSGAGAALFANLQNIFSTPPQDPPGLKTGSQALVAATGPDRLMTRAASDAFRREGLDTNVVKVSIWPVWATGTSLLVFDTDSVVQERMTPAQSQQQADIILRAPRIQAVRLARIARIVFVLRNFPERGQTSTFTFTFTFLERLATGVQPTDTEIRQQVFFQVTRR